MPYRANYPRTVAEVLDDAMRINRAALAAVRAFTVGRPYRRDARRRAELSCRLNDWLRATYGIRPPGLTIWWVDGSSGASHYSPASHGITLTGRFSVVTS